ncbi:MAG: hypothetical protein A3D64_01510 [Candidatus Wildermuthbacteria bacterium RIFCSPHIGHO2_02_FULL_49_9]|uniref:Uncharacterized protein n=2 Tax=Candidatus Wildermuthiibacteriota TaxID=1817923 RepID=A0A1G2QWY5_9BACT|nr:MAG: hypothetical protein A2672_01070 [Candidatus Wildermuthbacteria bacterium RIFCSPHIGHO2_01_FULL_49_22b]OHA71319.1 MAG: hypothetical protein A3D64_01510 [Candidatus Wildermuthbacteria bacterium RIFCSPHIGHO2_02_FULL_49_9]
MQKYVQGCESCIQFQDWEDPGSKVLGWGRIIIKGESVKWVAIESGQKAVSLGAHWIFTTSSHHIGAEDVEA